MIRIGRGVDAPVAARLTPGEARALAARAIFTTPARVATASAIVFVAVEIDTGPRTLLAIARTAVARLSSAASGTAEIDAEVAVVHGPAIEPRVAGFVAVTRAAFRAGFAVAFVGLTVAAASRCGEESGREREG
jgi:hypothetical protein